MNQIVDIFHFADRKPYQQRLILIFRLVYFWHEGWISDLTSNFVIKIAIFISLIIFLDAGDFRRVPISSFDLYKKFARWCSPTQTLTQTLKSWFLRFSSQKIGSSLISFKKIFKDLQSELLRFKFHIMSSKILKIPKFSLRIAKNCKMEF